MSFVQAALLILLGGMLVLFALERLRIEVVAIIGLFAGYALGLYPREAIFSGFSSPVTITVIEILLIVQVLARTRIVDALTDRLIAAEQRSFATIAALAGATAFISIFMNNIGAYALALPAALRLGELPATSRRQLLMPVSFAALLGGLVSLIGTPANLLVSRALEKQTGKGFHFFDFAYVGLPVAVVGVLLLAVLLPRLFPPEPVSTDETPDRLSQARSFIAERRVPAGSPLVGLPLERLPGAFGLEAYAVIREERFVFGERGKIAIGANDLLVLEAAENTLRDLDASGALASEQRIDAIKPDLSRSEAVIMPESTLVGSRIRSLDVFHSRGVAVTGLSTRSRRIEGRFADLRLSIGDILLLEGPHGAISDALEECECLPLASHDTRPPRHRSWLPIGLFAGGILSTALGLTPPEISFAGVILAMALVNLIQLRQALSDIDWPIIIMLAAMIPLGAAVATTGTADMLATSLGAYLPVDRPGVGVALVLFLGVAITPFVNNAAVAIILAPVAFELAAKAGHPPQAYLIAVAIGASVDFLTPFGHHNNTLTMSIGPYRFVDFLRAGLPLTLVSYGLALALIYLVWL
jgi:di/tricarboxylate transporter